MGGREVRKPLSKRADRVYVSNIAYTVNHQDLRDLFNDIGEVAYVEMLKDEKTKRPNGCAIVRFRDDGHIEEAVDRFNRYEHSGRKLVVKDYREKEFEGSNDRRDRKRRRSDEYSIDAQNKFGNTYGLSIKFLESLGIDGPLNNRVFVANLPYECDEEDLTDVFSIAGKVEDIELVHDDQGKIKGYGFVEYEHPIEAVQSISMLHKQTYKDRMLSVQYTQKEKRNKDGLPRLPYGLKGLGMGLGSNGAPLKNVARTIEAGTQFSALGALPVNNMANTPQLGMGPLGGMGMNLGSSGAFPGPGMGLSNQANILNNLSNLQTNSMNMGQGMMHSNDSAPFENKMNMQNMMGQSSRQSLMSEGPNMMQKMGIGPDSRDLMGSGRTSHDSMGPSRISHDILGSGRDSRETMGRSHGSRDLMGSSRGTRDLMESGRGSRDFMGSGRTSHDMGSGYRSQDAMRHGRNSEDMMGSGRKTEDYTTRNSQNRNAQNAKSSLLSVMDTANSIQVSNLPFDYTWKALTDLCQTFGEVNFAKMTGNGNGIVCFDSQSAAQRAVDMLDNQHFEGKILNAKII